MKETFFIDIDGTLVIHQDTLDRMLEVIEVIPGVVEKLNEIRNNGHTIILTTARPERSREVTVKQLESVGIIYDQLVMNLPVGKRTVVNDEKPNVWIMADSYTVKRNKGISCLDISKA